MDPLSNQIPYSPYDIEVFAYQIPHKHIIHQQVEVQPLPNPLQMMSTEEAKQAELNKKKAKEQKEKEKKKKQGK